MTPELEKVIVSLVNKPDPTILDVGCNDGTDTLAFLGLFPGARVYAFEPDPRAIRRFNKKVQDARAQLFPVAIGAREGWTQFHQSAGNPNENDDMPPWDLSGSIRKPKEHLTAHPWCTFDRQFDVPVMTLDAWATTYSVGDVDFIWADVQGAEGDLVLGAGQTLARTRFLFTEYSNHEMYEGQPTLDELLDMLPEFEVVHVYQEDVLLRNTRCVR